MQENISDLSRKYRDEMLRLYGNRSSPQSSAPPAVPAAAVGSVLSEPTDPPGMPEFSDTAEALEVPETPASDGILPEGEQPIVTEPPMEEEFGVEEDEPEVMGEPGNYEEPVLPSYIQPSPQPRSWQEREREEARNTETGKVSVAALTGNGAFPVPGAHVSITTGYGGDTQLHWSLITNESGQTPVVEMPAPPAALSQSPGNDRPYAVCTIEISAPGYFRTVAEEVPVFAGITSKQTFEMIPLPLRMYENSETLHFSRPEQEV